MAYAEMARSHVKELVRQTMHLAEVVEDDDGDLPFRTGRTAWYLSVRADGRRLKAWSAAVRGVKPSAALLREVNAANAQLECARVVVRDTVVYVEGTLGVESCTPADLDALCEEVATTADRVGTLIAAVHGGTTPFESDDESCPECGHDG